MAASSTSISDLPHEVLVLLLSFLSQGDRVAIAQVSRTWLLAARDPALWHVVDLRRAGNPVRVLQQPFVRGVAWSLQLPFVISDELLREIESLGSLRVLDSGAFAYLSEC